MFQWAEVLSADAFSAFEEAGLDNVKVWTADLYTSRHVGIYVTHNALLFQMLDEL